MGRRALYAFSLSMLPFMACTGMVYSVLPVYFSLGLDATPTQIGAVFTVGSAVAAIASPWAGRLADRLGRRRLVIASMASFAVALTLYSSVHNIGEAALVQVLEGLAWAFLSSSATAYVADLSPPEGRGWAMGVYHRSLYAGWIVGPIVGGYLADALGFRGMLLLSSALVVVGLIAVYAATREGSLNPH